MTQADVDVLIVGAGFAGLYALKSLRDQGFRVRVFEAGGGAGGTWYFNRYPGARCDVESVQYSYQFSPELQAEWTWSERYATQAEILRYIDHVVARFDLARDIRMGARVRSARYDASENVWRIVAAGQEPLTARYLVLAIGCLSSANVPEFPGNETFRGRSYHTGQWPHQGVDFSGLRVGVLGTGSSGIQAIPEIAKQAAHLTVFQRTANYSIPAHNRPLPEDESARIKKTYSALRADASSRPFAITFGDPPSDQMAAKTTADERDRDFARRWARGGLGFLGGFTDLIIDSNANAYAAEFVRAKIKSIVKDIATAEILCPRHLIGVKRICVDTDYYETFNRPNVSLIDLRAEPLVEITPNGLRTTRREVPLDTLVYATGFDAMTGSFDRIDIVGRAQSLREVWAGGPQTYLGLGVAGFPNMFILQGPGSPSVLTNMIVSSEFHVTWLTQCLQYLRHAGVAQIEAEPSAQSDWVRHVNEVAHTTLYPEGNSWYLGANIPGKPRVFMPYLGFPGYVDRANAVAAQGYKGFKLSS